MRSHTRSLRMVLLSQSMLTTMPDLVLQLASDTTLAKDGCTLSVTNTPHLKGRTGQTLAGEHMIECGRDVQNILTACPNMNM
ncbi:hypothetical protein EDC04DRAFT_2660873 [Pisolithus marmoratus]|nr:hypothetical protein EDC04DRAFT_2660873 [Pisolithus marmoratus]